MNEVARCAQIALGIAAVTASSSEPVALADPGTGAGWGCSWTGTGTWSERSDPGRRPLP